MHWIDPDCLPETVGRVDLFLLNPHGDVDGMILADWTEVHLPPHMGPDIVGALRPGSLVKLRAVRPRGSDLLAAVAFETEDGTRYEDHGPPKHHKVERKRADAPKSRKVRLEGVVRRTLHGPKGETRGLLLADGRSGRFPPHAAEDLGPLLRAGTSVVLHGESIVTEYGTVVTVREIGAPNETPRPIAGKPKDHKPKGSKPPKKKPHHPL